jgi:hypothetical protein
MDKTHKQQFDQLVQAGIRKQEDDLTIVKNLVDRLIENLYKPCEDERVVEATCTFVGDESKIKKYGIHGEPINWGDLGVCDVVKDRDSDLYIVTVDEAAPDDCPAFCAYIEKFMKLWGWHVQVKTEW